ncbi:hypothetical protein BC835DRAFT_1306793 [Cytidiella melzeri]|nr:hypothetical protein BC835DRAFT_1306793 [Cytidiella melzeri]
MPNPDRKAPVFVQREICASHEAVTAILDVQGHRCRVAPACRGHTSEVLPRRLRSGVRRLLHTRCIIHLIVGLGCSNLRAPMGGAFRNSGNLTYVIQRFWDLFEWSGNHPLPEQNMHVGILVVSSRLPCRFKNFSIKASKHANEDMVPLWILHPENKCVYLAKITAGVRRAQEALNVVIVLHSAWRPYTLHRTAARSTHTH